MASNQTNVIVFYLFVFYLVTLSNQGSLAQNYETSIINTASTSNANEANTSVGSHAVVKKILNIWETGEPINFDDDELLTPSQAIAGSHNVMRRGLSDILMDSQYLIPLAAIGLPSISIIDGDPAPGQPANSLDEPLLGPKDPENIDQAEYPDGNQDENDYPIFTQPDLQQGIPFKYNPKLSNTLLKPISFFLVGARKLFAKITMLPQPVQRIILTIIDLPLKLLPGGSSQSPLQNGIPSGAPIQQSPVSGLQVGDKIQNVAEKYIPTFKIISPEYEIQPFAIRVAQSLIPLFTNGDITLPLVIKILTPLPIRLMLSILPLPSGPFQIPLKFAGLFSTRSLPRIQITLPHMMFQAFYPFLPKIPLISVPSIKQLRVPIINVMSLIRQDVGGPSKVIKPFNFPMIENRYEGIPANRPNFKPNDPLSALINLVLRPLRIDLRRPFYKITLQPVNMNLNLMSLFPRFLLPNRERPYPVFKLPAFDSISGSLRAVKKEFNGEKKLLYIELPHIKNSVLIIPMYWIRLHFTSLQIDGNDPIKLPLSDLIPLPIRALLKPFKFFNPLKGTEIELPWITPLGTLKMPFSFVTRLLPILKLPLPESGGFDIDLIPKLIKVKDGVPKLNFPHIPDPLTLAAISKPKFDDDTLNIPAEFLNAFNPSITVPEGGFNLTLPGASLLKNLDLLLDPRNLIPHITEDLKHLVFPSWIIKIFFETNLKGPIKVPVTSLSPIHIEGNNLKLNTPSFGDVTGYELPGFKGRDFLIPKSFLDTVLPGIEIPLLGDEDITLFPKILNLFIPDIPFTGSDGFFNFQPITIDRGDILIPEKFLKLIFPHISLPGDIRIPIKLSVPPLIDGFPLLPLANIRYFPFSFDMRSLLAPKPLESIFTFFFPNSNLPLILLNLPLGLLSQILGPLLPLLLNGLAPLLSLLIPLTPVLMLIAMAMQMLFPITSLPFLPWIVLPLLIPAAVLPYMLPTVPLNLPNVKSLPSKPFKISYLNSPKITVPKLPSFFHPLKMLANQIKKLVTFPIKILENILIPLPIRLLWKLSPFPSVLP